MTAADVPPAEPRQPSVGVKVHSRARTHWSDAAATALAGPQAGRPLFLVVWSLALLFRSSISDSIIGIARTGTVTLSYLAAIGTSWCVFAVCALIRRRIAAARPRGLFTIAMLSTIAASSAVVQQMIDQRLALGVAFGFVRAGIGTGFLIGVVILLDQRGRQNAIRQDLLVQKQRLQAVRDSYQTVLGIRRQRLADTVTETIGPRLTEIRQRLWTLPDHGEDTKNLRDCANLIRASASGLVRGLSHALDVDETQPRGSALPERERPAAATFDLESVAALAGSGTGASVAKRRSPSSTALSAAIERVGANPFWPIPTAIVAAAICGSTTTVVRGPAESLAALITFGMSCLVILTAAERWLAPHLLNAKNWVRLFTAIGVYAASAALATLGLTQVTVVVYPVRVFLTQFVGLLIVAALLVVGRAFWREQRRATLELSATVEAISWESARLQDDDLAIRRQIAEILHGAVQGRLLAIALQLDICADHLVDHRLADHPGASAGQSTDPAYPDLRGSVRQAIAALDDTIAMLGSLASTQGPHDVADVAVELDNITSSWRGVISINIEFADDALRRINSSPSTRSTITRIVSEAITNASRHGKATQITITITANDSTARLCAIDNGAGPCGGVGTNLGLRSMNRAGSAATLRRAPSGGAELTVTLPLLNETTAD